MSLLTCGFAAGSDISGRFHLTASPSTLLDPHRCSVRCTDFPVARMASLLLSLWA